MASVYSVGTIVPGLLVTFFRQMLWALGAVAPFGRVSGCSGVGCQNGLSTT